MNYASNIVTVIESVVNQMTPTLTITDVTTNSATNWTVEVCKTYWVHIGQRLTIDGNAYTVTDFELNTNITLKGTVEPGLVSFQLDAPNFWHGSHRKVESERAKRKDVTKPVVYLPISRTTQSGAFDSDIAYTATVRLIFLLNYIKRRDTTELQQSEVIDPANEMADLFCSLIEADDRFNDPENLRRIEWMNFGDQTVWGNDELIFDQPLSGVELQLDLEVLLFSFCECPDQGTPEVCPDVTTTFNGTATGVDTASGQEIAIEVVDDTDTPTGTLTTNTANTKKIVVSGGGPCDPAGIELNGVTALTDADSGTTRNFDLLDEEDNVITPVVDSDTATNTVLYFSDVPMTFNGNATAGALVGSSKSITVQDTDGTQVGTAINDQQTNLTIEVPKGVTDIIHVRDLWQAGDQETATVGSLGWYKANTSIFDDNQPSEGLAMKLDPDDDTLLLTENEWGNFNRVTNDRGGSNYADVGGGLTSDGATANIALDNYTGTIVYLNSLHAGTQNWNDSVTTAQAHTVTRYDGSTYNQWQMMPPKLIQHYLTGDGQDSHIFIGIENWSDTIHWVMGLSVGATACYIWRENQPWNATNLFQSFSRTSVNSGVDLIVWARKEDYV